MLFRPTNTLLRVTYSDMVSFDDNGFLLSHYFVQNDGQPDMYSPKSVPLTDAQDWETVARVLAFPGEFQILRIDARQIQNLSHRPHILLQNGEYFGHVPKSAIKARINYTWREDGRPYEARNITPEWDECLGRTSGFSPVVAFV
ncbi:MAG TPA: hypothetical protein VI968_03645 [archaeon]|nr:hypothetical protein [archaeon]